MHYTTRLIKSHEPLDESNLIEFSNIGECIECKGIIAAVTHTFCPRFPEGYLAWVVISLGFRSGNFSDYTADSYPRATFDLAVCVYCEI